MKIKSTIYLSEYQRVQLEMDLIHKFLNIVFPLISLITIPPFLVFKSINFIMKWVCSETENVAGKVVLITGASSGIGEYLAYEYAKKGACLALVARREDRLQAVAGKAQELGSPDVISIRGDVSEVDDCRRFVAEAMNHFGRLDHLVNNAGIAPVCMFEDYTDVTNHASVMNINFWGSVYITHFAIPHLRKSKGKIIVISSCAGWLPTPRLSLYSASKGALISFYETLRTEVGSDIGITMVTPGLIESEITQDEFLTKAKLKNIPRLSTERCAEAILSSTCRGERYLTEPAWTRVMILWRLLCPEVLDGCNHFFLIDRPSHERMMQNNNRIQDQNAEKNYANRTSAVSLEFKAD